MISAAVGFRSKTGRATAVVLAGEPATPVLVWRGEVSLVDPDVPSTAEPYHTVMELPWHEAEIAVRPLNAAIQRAAQRMLGGLVEQMRRRDAVVRAVGVVGSAPRDLARIGNFHIRAHAAEGVLFRQVLVDAAREQRLPVSAFSEKELAAALSSSRRILAALGRSAGPPWRVGERLAAMAALSVSR